LGLWPSFSIVICSQTVFVLNRIIMYIYADFYFWSGIDTFFKHLKELAKIAKQLNSGCQNSILCPVDGKYHSHILTYCMVQSPS